MSSDSLSVEDLRSQLSEYEEQFSYIDGLLQEDPINEEYLALKHSTLELIYGLRELISTTTSSFPGILPPQVGQDRQPDVPISIAECHPAKSNISDATSTSLAQMAIDASLYVGLICEAIWPEDQQWYPCIVECISDAGVRIKFTGYGDVIIQHPKFVRISQKFVDAITKKRKYNAHVQTSTNDISTSTPSSSNSENELDPDSLKKMGLPPHLVILETDGEQTREMKRRKIKVWKQERRREERDILGYQSKMTWEIFNKQIGSKRKFATKKESIFKSPDGGRIGVTGSGKAMTQSSAFEHIKKQTTTYLPPISDFSSSSSPFSSQPPLASRIHEPLASTQPTATIPMAISSTLPNLPST